MITVKADPSKRVTYGELIGGKRFNVALTGNNIDATTGVAKVKPVQELKIVGQSPQRYDIPAKVDGSLKWAVDVKLPGMVHARNVKPPVAGAKLISIDESSVRGLPGFVKVVSKGNYVAVVCEREEQAIKAAQTAQGELAEAGDARRSRRRKTCSTTCAARRRRRAASRPWSGNPDAALAGAAKVVEAEYDVPFQGHTAIGPAHAHGRSVERPDDDLLQRHEVVRHAQRRRRSSSSMPRDQVRVVWMEGPQGYGRTAADDAGFEAAYLAKEIGRPVRVQWMRNEETAWDTKGPAFTFKMRGGLDAQGNLVALDYDARAADYNHLGYNEPDTVLIAQLMGTRRADAGRGQRGDAVGHVRHPEPAHGDAGGRACRWCGRRRCAPATCAIPTVRRSTFASESFIDELAAAAKADPVEFRLKLLTAGTDRRQRLQAGALDRRASRRRREAYGWDAASVAEAASAPATSSPGAASPTPSAARPSSPRSPRSR